MRGIRGAITVKENTKNEIKKSANLLIKTIIDENKLDKEEIVSIIFTATSDLNQAYPAKAVREMGFKYIPLMCYQEMEVKNSLPRCLRVIVYTNRNSNLSSIKHIYLREAKKLRPDLTDNNKNNDLTLPTRKVKLEKNLIIGGQELLIIAGPCAVESQEQIMTTAEIVSNHGAKILRGGAYKPRTSPYSFQGLKEKGLKLLKMAAQKTGLKIVTEVMDPRHVDLVGQYTDIFQIGSRNMQNYYLLKEVGKTNKPVLLKRGMNASYREFLGAAEYIKVEGNDKIILCERGIKTFEDYTRYTLDLVSIPVLKQLANYPIIIDPSHGTGRRELIIPAAKGAIAMGADGLMIEVHPHPESALSDGKQSLKTENMKELINQIHPIAKIYNRKIKVGDNH